MTTQIFGQIYKDVLGGNLCSPRGLLIKELQDYQYKLPGSCNLVPGYKLPYLKAETQWYLKGDLKDISIADYAPIWANHVDDEGELQSNYGNCVFTNGQLRRAYQELTEDRESRRAAISILNEHHLLRDKYYDVPCTTGFTFRIRNDSLNMSVHMRSQDAVLGMRNDVFFFNFVGQLLAAKLGILFNNMTVTVDSFHVYEKNFSRATELSKVDDPLLNIPEMTKDTWSNAVDGTDIDNNYWNWLYELSD